MTEAVDLSWKHSGSQPGTGEFHVVSGHIKVPCVLSPRMLRKQPQESASRGQMTVSPNDCELKAVERSKEEKSDRDPGDLCG